MEHARHDVAIIGGGAAGLSAAVVLGRARRRVVVIDAGTPRNAPAAHMQGFLSRDGMPPTELLRVAREEVRHYGVELVEDRVVEASVGLTLTLAGGETVRARQALIATGAADEPPDIPGARERPAISARPDRLGTALGCEAIASGLLQTDADGRTSVPGVRAAGNATNPRAQVITAAGE